MRRDELVGRLRQPYTPGRGWGTARVQREGYENVWFVVPPPPPRDLPAGLPAGLIGRANALLQARPRRLTAQPLDRLTAYLFARREAVSSSRLEGTWSTIDSVLTPADDPEAEAGRSQTLSVRAYAAALEVGAAEIEEQGVRALTVDLLCRLHALVMSRDPDFRGVPGRLRAPGLPGDVVQIGGSGRREESLYNPAPPAHVARCLDEVMAWHTDEEIIELGEAGMGLSLPLRMAIGHAHFEAVHPFTDGNGRIGRIIWPLQMTATGILPLYLSGYVEQQRQAYSQALQAAQKQLAYGDIIAFLCEAIIASVEEEAAGKSAIAALPDAWETRIRPRRGSAGARALEVVVSKPILTARSLSEDLQVSFQAASSALNTLTKAGVLRERTGHGRNRIFAAEEVIAILARPFADDPEIALEGARRLLGVA